MARTLWSRSKNGGTEATKMSWIVLASSVGHCSRLRRRISPHGGNDASATDFAMGFVIFLPTTALRIAGQFVLLEAGL